MKRRLRLLLIIMFAIIGTACNNKGNDIDTEETAQQTKLYFIDNNTSTLVSEDYSPIASTKEALVEEYLDALKAGPKNIAYKKAIPDTVSAKEFSFLDDRLTINFDTAYNELKGIPEVLCRATIVKTLSQIKEVEYIEFYVNGQYVGLWTSEDFIDSTQTATEYQVSLYFANEAGDGLVEWNKKLYHTGTDTIEEQVIKQLINGPTERGMYATVPEGTTLLNVTSKDGIVYVDFNEKFLEKLPDITDDVAIYSIVNSLVGVPGINKVQFMINGEITKKYRNTSFDALFERNLSLIEETKTN
ncbi:MAG: hypothetical protein K0S47_1495 [Herbinix sp.]|jgi:germination protein M|nr:hypothetical protein [Herbinix sp.]